MNKHVNNHYLFVYGTLRKGMSNHNYLSDAIFLGLAKTDRKYKLTTDFKLPYVTNLETISNIKGELYMINDDTLKRIDIMEGHPYEYKRKKIKVILNKNKKTFLAWVYFSSKDADFLISDGDFVKFKQKHKFH